MSKNKVVRPMHFMYHSRATMTACNISIAASSVGATLEPKRVTCSRCMKAKPVVEYIRTKNQRAAPQPTTSHSGGPDAFPPEPLPDFAALANDPAPPSTDDDEPTADDDIPVVQ